MNNCTEPNRAACPRLCSDFCNAKEEADARRSAAACSQVVESELTVAQVEYTHCFGECWIKDYDRTKREYWEKALWLWAWDRKVIWQQNRMVVPAGLNPANASVEPPKRKESQ